MWILSNFAAGEGGVSLLHHVGCSFFASVSFATKIPAEVERRSDGKIIGNRSTGTLRDWRD